MSSDDRGWSDEEQLVQYLAEFGFGRNEARMYLAAVGGPPLRVAELAELADVNRPKAYDALYQLVDKGLFAEVTGQESGQGARYQAADPMLVVQRLRHQSGLEQADRRRRGRGARGRHLPGPVRDRVPGLPPVHGPAGRPRAPRRADPLRRPGAGRHDRGRPAQVPARPQPDGPNQRAGELG